MSATAEALMHKIVHPALPTAAMRPAPAEPPARETAAILIGRILNPGTVTSDPRQSR